MTRNPILAALKVARVGTVPERLYPAWSHVLHAAVQTAPDERLSFTDATDEQVREALAVVSRLASRVGRSRA